MDGYAHDISDPIVSESLAVTLTSKRNRSRPWDDHPELLSRLRWLDSTIALDDEVVAPFTPIEVRRGPNPSQLRWASPSRCGKGR